MITHRYAGNAGFTLVEMLIAVAISGVVGMAALTVYTSSTRTTTAQTDLTQVQQNVRAAMDRLTQHTRSAGFGLPERESFSLTFGTDTFTRAVTVTNSATAPDTLTLVGIGQEAGILKAYQADGCNEAGKSCLSLVSNAEFISSGAFHPRHNYISLGGAAFLEVSGVTGSNIITLTEPLASLPSDFFNITPRPSVFILKALRYTIATNLTGCSAEQPCLAVQDFSELGSSGGRQVLAQGIEDLQIGVFTSPAAGGSATFSNNASSSSARIAALRINLVGKAQNPDPSATFIRPALEDHPAASTPDNFRRRDLTTVVKIRNPRPDS